MGATTKRRGKIRKKFKLTKRATIRRHIIGASVVWGTFLKTQQKNYLNKKFSEETGPPTPSADGPAHPTRLTGEAFGRTRRRKLGEK